jgi:predicted nucleic acid-binding protein
MPMAGEILFTDTNILLTATDRSRNHHEAARNLLMEAGTGKFHLALSGQVLREYLVVATRPVDVNGLGLSMPDALRNVEVFTSPPFVFCEETETVSVRLRELAATHGLVGRRLHDANLVATMLVHGISRMVTQNTADFLELREIQVCDLHEA